MKWLNNNISMIKVSGSAITRFTLKKINEFMIPLPPLNEQNRIASILEDEFSKENLILDKINKTEDYLDKLFKRNLDKAFRGELVEQRPEEGTGVDLLKQIIEELLATTK